MKARTMRNRLRKIRRWEDFLALCQQFSWRWARGHKGRIRVVRLLERIRRQATAKPKETS